MEGGGAGRRGVPRGRCGAYIGAGAGPRCAGPRRGRGVSQPDSSGVRARHELRDGPNQRVPPIGGFKRGRREAGLSWAKDEEGKLGRLVGFGKEKKKEREKEFGPKRERKKRKSLLNFDQFHLNSNLNLNSTEVRQIKQCIAIWMQDKKSNFIYFRKTTNYYLFFLY